MYRKVHDFYLNEIERYILFLKKLTPYELDQLKEGLSKVQFDIKPLQPKAQKVTPENKEMISMLLRIAELANKEEVDNYFESLHLKRKELEEMCKLKDIPFTKRDNMTVLRDKIYERIVGFRIRSKAIQYDKS